MVKGVKGFVIGVKHKVKPQAKKWRHKKGHGGAVPYRNVKVMKKNTEANELANLKDLHSCWCQLEALAAVENRGTKIIKELALTVIGKTIQFVLEPGWQTISATSKDRLKDLISNCSQRMNTLCPELCSQCSSVLHLMEEPWGNPVLKDLMHGRPYEDSAVLRFFEEDRLVLKYRVMKLYADKACHDIAQLIVSVVWKFCKINRTLLSFFPDEDLISMLDPFLIILINQNRCSETIDQMIDVPINLGLQFVCRLKQHHHQPPDKRKVWRHSLRAAKVVVQIMATRAIKETNENTVNILEEVVSQFVEIFQADKNLFDMVKKLGTQAATADHIAVLGKCLQKKFGKKYLLLCIKFSMKLLLRDVNEIEHWKTVENVNEQQAAQNHLAKGFLSLSELLSDNVNEFKECMLSSFSLSPTSLGLQKLCELAGNCDDIKESATESNIDELPPQLRDDLHIILHCTRNRKLSWKKEWPELKRICEAYLREGKVPAIKELKFLDIDYSMFDNLPAIEDDNYGGLEKGYEIDNEFVSPA